MKKKNCRDLLVFIGLLAFCLTARTLSAQTEADMTAKQAKNGSDLASMQAALKKDILKQLNKSTRWSAYQAFRSNNTARCDSSESGQGCWKLVQNINFLKTMAQGDCGSLPTDFKPYADVCAAVKSSSCASLAGWKNVYCQAFVQDDPSFMIKAFNSSDFPEYVKNKGAMAEFQLNIYRGFKKNNEAACDKFSANVNLLRRSCCNMLLGDQSAALKLEGLSQDIATALIAKQSDKKDLCSRISNPAVKAACSNNNVTSLSDILAKVWD